MVKIRDLAKELGVGSSEIIYFLKNSAFAFSYKLGEYYEIDTFWESKVRSHFHQCKNRKNLSGGTVFVGDLAAELNIQPAKIIDYLLDNYPDKFTNTPQYFHNNKLSVYDLDQVWVQKIRTVFSKKSVSSKSIEQLKTSISDLAKKLNVQQEEIRDYLMSRHPDAFPSERKTRDIDNSWISEIENYFRGKPAKSAEQLKKQPSSNVYTSAFDVPNPSSSTNVYKSAFDVPNTNAAEQRKEEYMNIDILAEELGVEQEEIRNYLARVYPKSFPYISDTHNIKEPFLSSVKSYFSSKARCAKTEKPVNVIPQNNQKTSVDVRHIQANIAQKNIKNTLVDLQENILKHMSGNDERFWEDIVDLIKKAKLKVDNKVKLAFAGKMKAGKSSLVNMMLGDDLAKVGLKSTTHIITEFHYDDENPRVEFVNNEEKIIEQYHFDEIGKEKARSKMEDRDKNCYFIRIWCDIEILKKFVLVDIPGAGDADENLNKYTEEYLTTNEVSTIIWVHRPESGWKNDEKEFVNKLIALKKNLYFVFNDAGASTEDEIREKEIPEFKKYHPQYEPRVLSVKKAEKADREKLRETLLVKPKSRNKSEEWIKEQVDKEFEDKQKEYKELFEKQKKLKDEFITNAKNIREKNARAIVSLLPDEIQKNIKTLRNEAVEKRTEQRKEFFKLFKGRIVDVFDSVKDLESKLRHDFKRCNDAADTDRENGMSSINVLEKRLKPFFRDKVIPIVADKFDDKFKTLEKYGNLFGLDFFQKVILFKELVILDAERKYEQNPECFSDLSNGLIDKLKLMSVLITLDCLKNFFFTHNEIWQNYLNVKNYVVEECFKKSGIDFSRAELFNKNETFDLSSSYKEWVDTTLAICKTQILSDDSKTESENRIFKELKTAFVSEMEKWEDFKSHKIEQGDFPMIFRLKLESCNRKEIREMLNMNTASTNEWFDKMDKLLRKNIEDFTDFFVECIGLFSVTSSSTIFNQNKKQIGINFLPEEKI